MKCIIRNTIFFMTSLAVVLPIMVAPALARVLLEEDFERGISVDMPGILISSDDDGAWTTGFLGTEDDGPGVFLTYDPATVLNPEAGTIEFELSRNNLRASEALFSLNSPDSDSLLSAYIFWDGFTQKQFPELKFEGVSPGRVWYTKLQSGAELESVPLGITVDQGDVVHLAFAWGKDPSLCKIYVNGRELAVLADTPFGMEAVIDGAATFNIGAEPMKIGDGAYDHLNSLINRFRVSDTSLDQKDLLAVPKILSISHDAFQVAGYSGKLVAGDTLTVTIKAESGGIATFDLIQPTSTSKGVTTPERVRIADHAMTEDPDNPGIYRGVHTIKYGEDVEDGQVVGHYVSEYDVEADSLDASRPITVDTKVYMAVNTSNDLIPADEDSKAGITIVAKDANGRVVKDRELKLTLSTTDEYTGTVGGGSFEDLVGGEIDVDWGGITDSFGEVTAQYVSGFAAKTIFVSAKDMVSGDVGVGYVRSFIEGEVEIVVTEPKVSALSVAGTMDVSLSRDWLTADGKSRSRITALIKDAEGKPLSGHNIKFTLLGDNGKIRVVQGKTDAGGRAFADYIAGTLMGQVQVEVRDLTSGMVILVPIELRPDAPAVIALAADPGEVVTGGISTVTAKVTDTNGNPNHNVDVIYNISVGAGELDSPRVATDEDGVASVQFTAGDKAEYVKVRGTVISREPTADEISAAEGAVFLYGLDEAPSRLTVVEWFVEPGDEVVEGQDLVTLEDRRDTLYTIVAPRDGIVSTFVAEERDRVEYGDTLGYIVEQAE